jgi:hypothetical protein
MNASYHIQKAKINLAGSKVLCLIRRRMQLAQQHSGFRRTAKPALAGLLVLLLLFIAALASSPTLHNWFHDDARSPDHNCVITLFAKGQLSPTAVASILVALVALLGAVALLAETILLPSADYRYSSSRAPPSLLIHLG